MVCPICQDELVWLGGCVLMTKNCLHLCHRDCFQAYRRSTPFYKMMLCPYCREESHLRGTGGDRADINTARDPITLDILDHPDYYEEESMWEPNNLDYLTLEEREWLERENAIYWQKMDHPTTTFPSSNSYQASMSINMYTARITYARFSCYTLPMHTYIEYKFAAEQPHWSLARLFSWLSHLFTYLQCS